MADEYINKTELLFEMATSLIPQSMDITRGYAIAKDLIRNAPVADVAPVVHGEWIKQEQEYPMMGCKVIVGYKCSVCGGKQEPKTNYCCDCGALMDGGGKRKVGFYIDPKDYNISQRLSNGGNKNGTV